MKISGKITDSLKDPLMGVNIVYSVDNGQKEVTSNSKGIFSLDTDETQEITISSIGYLPKKVVASEINDKTIILYKPEEQNQDFDISNEKPKSATPPIQSKSESAKPNYALITIGALLLASTLLYLKHKAKWKA